MRQLHQRVWQEQDQWAEREGPERLRTLSLPSGALSSVRQCARCCRRPLLQRRPSGKPQPGYRSDRRRSSFPRSLGPTSRWRRNALPSRWNSRESRFPALQRRRWLVNVFGFELSGPPYGYRCASLEARGAPEHAKAGCLDFSAVCGENSARPLAGK